MAEQDTPVAQGKAFGGLHIFLAALDQGAGANRPGVIGPRRDSELLALRAARNCRSAFEWGHHVHYARAAGLSEDEIAKVGGGAPEDGWAERDRILLQAADELHARQDVSDETWKQLAAHFDESQLVEIPFVVGNYTMLSMVANATGVPLEPDLPEPPF